MDDFPINVLDGIILAVIVLSAIVGMVRGFVREILSLAAWIGAGWIALTFFGESSAYSRTLIENQVFADVVAGVGVFVVSLVILTIIARVIARLVQGSNMVGPLDRMLGMIFGVFRGGILVCLAFMFTALLVSEAESIPGWVKGSRLIPYVREGVEMLEQFIPDDLGLSEKVNDNWQKVKSTTDNDSEFGYTPDDSVGRLIEQQLQD